MVSNNDDDYLEDYTGKQLIELYIADNGTISLDTLLDTREGIIYGLAFGDEKYDDDTLLGALIACERMIVEMAGVTKKTKWQWPPRAGGENL
jgi:hypothetical protein